jgi:hypothetical protein
MSQSFDRNNLFSKSLSHFSLFDSQFFARRDDYAELALPNALCSWRRRSQRAFQQTTDLVEKLRTQNVAFEELIIPDEIHDLLRWSDWIRAYRATAEFFDRRLVASGERK